MKELRVVVIGQPNVGKSSLLNALVGSRVVVSNYPGTTVELIRAKKVIGDTAIYFEDTPGIYSISDRSEEEKITEKSLLEEKIDRAVVIADSTSFDRSLYLAFQILEARIPVIIALNFVEDAQKKGIIIDSEKLEELISVPVVPINPLNKKGINQLLDTILNYESRSDNNFTIKYDDDLENAIKEISPHISGTRLPERFVALRILEQDIDFDKYLEK
jgi:ferrous iron transport protein B